MEYGKNLSHAYIIYSPNLQESYDRAVSLAADMLCRNGNGKACRTCKTCDKVMRGIHPDVITVECKTGSDGKKKKEIVVEQIRQIIADTLILPNEAERKVYIIKDAAQMNTAAQNALLKILEEPPRFVSFILLAQSTGEMLETVRSRCVGITLSAKEEEPSAEMRDKALRLAAACAKHDKIALLAFCNENAELKNAEADEFALAAIGIFTDMLAGRLPDMKMGKRDIAALIALMEKMREYLRFNVSPKHIFGLISVSAVK